MDGELRPDLPRDLSAPWQPATAPPGNGCEGSFTGALDWATGPPDLWSNSLRVSLCSDEIHRKPVAERGRRPPQCVGLAQPAEA